MPNLHLESSSGTTVDLWQVQEDQDSRDGNVDVADIPSFDADESYVSGLTQQHEGTLSGLATGNRLSRQSGYSDDPVTALAEWVQRVMALHNGQQGTGLTLTHDVRNQSVNVVLSTFGWTRTAGDSLELEWNMEFRIGEGVMVDGETAANTAAPSSTWSLDGRDLQHPMQYREEKSQRVEVAEMAYADSPEENLVKDRSGVTRSITITGRHTGSRSERKAFDDHLRSLIGQDQIVTYQSAFPGHALDVMVNRYDSLLEAGITRQGRYQLELIEGTH